MIRRLLAVFLTIGLLTGCGEKAPADSGVLSFTGKTIDGQAFDAATLAGKPALLWFWAPWCATCAGQAGSVQEVQEVYAGKLGVLGIAGLGSNAEMHEFVSDLEIPDVRTLDDEAGEVWRKFGITQQSTYVLIDAGGTVVTSSYLDSVDLPAKVKTLVG
ncbi:redoxin family protein [Actinoplanes sp. NBRC 103695]|uniref:redoxin family protein n=1 Tax=Actinoplanes sp. NBRC 103695 TaxID=3032202 RepID=UPI0024A24127|nr:redoxin family protein [Actinoplanes sp. NBRC 103695]GLY98546.1 hypothetical protein Acsp02_58000 [Actinoplanes sp. NBRC 103695]